MSNIAKMLQKTILCFYALLTLIYAQAPHQWQVYQPAPYQPINPLVFPNFIAKSNGGAAKPLLNTAATNNTLEISNGTQQFGIDLFTETLLAHHNSGQRRDFMISPFSIWALLLLLLEGASGNTAQQLRNALHINVDQETIRRAFLETASTLRSNTSTVEIASLQAIFTDKNQPVLREYEYVIENKYGVNLVPVDFNDVNKTYHDINRDVNKATRGLIQHAISPQDLQDAQLILLSSLYFKGRWQYPFNKTLTTEEPFYDEDGNMIGNVQMMSQEEHFNYVSIDELGANVLEMPYGFQNRLSMLILLPKRGVKLNVVAQNFRRFGITGIFERLLNAEKGFEDDTVEVLMPRFSTHTDLYMQHMLRQLGITDIFENTANFSKMSPRELFVTKILHGTKITVDEEGTEAAAITTASLIYKLRPPRFHLNRPFIYLIVEKSVNLLIFAGQVVNPNKFNY